jgi:spore germination cell wall hydrolase CwlJ-like protein
MKLSFLLWLASLLPQSAGDPLCLATTVYLEARDQSSLGQRAVAEVALRRQQDGRWGESVCDVVTAPKQFAPSLVNPNLRLGQVEAWQQAVDVAFRAQQDWSQPLAQRHEIVPGASHFATRSATPTWAHYPTVARIGDHVFYKVDRLAR